MSYCKKKTNVTGKHNKSEYEGKRFGSLTVIKYTNPVIKAVISDDGRILNGTWSCTVEISLSDYKFAGSPVDSTMVVLDNKITVNGGFSA